MASILANAITILILVLILALAIRSIIRQRKNGSCCSGCNGCDRGCSQCSGLSGRDKNCDKCTKKPSTKKADM